MAVDCLKVNWYVFIWIGHQNVSNSLYSVEMLCTQTLQGPIHFGIIIPELQ